MATTASETMHPRLLRPAAGLFAAALALGIVALLYLIADIPSVESVAHVRFVLGPDGFLLPGGALALVLAWASAPIAAGVSGFLFARATVRRERWAGAWMGLVTYFLALLLASLIPDLTRAVAGEAPWGQSIFEAAVGAPVMAVLAGSVLAPLFFSCIAAGLAWAWIVRRYASVPTSDPMPNTMLRGFALSMLVFIAGMTVLGWIVFGSMFALLTGDGEFID